jgi:hypothetical protein
MSDRTAHVDEDTVRPHAKETEMPAITMETYEPDLPPDDWAHIRNFVLDLVTEVSDRLPYPTAAALNAVAHHVDWCVNVADMPMDRGTLFRRDVIGAAVAVMPTKQTSTQGRRRSLLFRVGETLGAIPVPEPLPPLAAASPTAPYSPADIEEITRWAYMQQDGQRVAARVLVALGLGAGLPTRDIATVRAIDVLGEGEEIRLGGSAPRIVPVSDDWSDELYAITRMVADREAPLFRPGVAWTKNVVTNFVKRSYVAAIRPTTQRMRSTWLVQHLAAGTPMQDLLAAAGLSSMDALVRYEQFLPPSPRTIHHAGMPR